MDPGFALGWALMSLAEAELNQRGVEGYSLGGRQAFRRASHRRRSDSGGRVCGAGRGRDARRLAGGIDADRRRARDRVPP